MKLDRDLGAGLEIAVNRVCAAREMADAAVAVGQLDAKGVAAHGLKDFSARA
jgi:hypothetical protein